jgi:hypothetical protein
MNTHVLVKTVTVLSLMGAPFASVMAMLFILSRVLSARGNNKRGFSGFNEEVYLILPVVTTVIHFTTLQHINQRLSSEDDIPCCPT